jgi:hypothetical protein
MTGIGVRRLLDQLAEAPVRPRFCIVGEPTLMQVATAHKGKASWRVTAHGLEAHSSLAPNGVNAIHLAVDLIGRIRAMQDEIAASGARDGDYDVPYTTLHVGIISGGETINIVPNRASFDFEIRYLPGDDVDEMFRRIAAAAEEIAQAARARFAGARLEFEPLASYPALDTGPDEEIVTFREIAHRRERDDQDQFRHRGRAFPAAPGRALGGVRAGRHRGCPQARRIRRGEPAGGLFGLPVTARRCLERMSRACNTGAASPISEVQLATRESTAMRTETPTPIKLDDYRPAAWLVDQVGLDVRLEPHETIVASRLELRPNPKAGAGPAPLWLDGEHLRR